MTTSSTFQELQNLLLFPVKGPDDRKRLLVAGLLGFAGFIIPIIPGIFLLGYAGLIMRNIIQEKVEPSMLEWKDWGKMFILGLKLGGASFIYSLPAFIVMFLGYASMMLPAFLQAFSNPQSYSDVSPFVGISFIGMFGGMALFGVGFILFIPTLLALPPMMSHVAKTDSFSAAFHFKDWWRVFRSNIGGFAITLILTAGLYFLVIFAFQILYMTIILCITIPFLLAFLMAYLTIIASALFAIAYREGDEKLSGQEFIA